MISRSLRVEVLKLRKLPPNKCPGTSTVSEVQGEAPSTSGHVQMINDGYVKYNVQDGQEDGAVYQDVNTEQSTVTGAVSLDRSNSNSRAADSVTVQFAYASKVHTSNAYNQGDISPYYEDIK